MGVFATGSPFRPNAIGLSCVKLLSVEPSTPEGPVLTVAGADLMDGTPIFDIKPYISYADCQPDATGGFTDTAKDFLLDVEFPPELLSHIPKTGERPCWAYSPMIPAPPISTAPSGFTAWPLEILMCGFGWKAVRCMW